MNRDTRISKIALIIEREKDNPYGKQDIPWQDRLTSMPVFQIPLEYLIYNKYNGRILSRTKSLERQGRVIDAEAVEGKEIIETLLWNSNVGRNKQTLESITKIGQEKVGIITRDGIIIDGNRRALLLAEAGKDYFKTVVLPVTLEENPLEIEKLETTFQMGEDEKLGYNATEKYLKAKSLKNRGVSEDDIASWMGETKSKIEEYLGVMETMDDYLDYVGYTGIYTQLDDREDPFIYLTKWKRNFYGENSVKAFDGYRKDDVDDLILICYDYIRIKYEGKDFRIIADGLRGRHFFGDKNIWKDFRDYHFNRINAIKDKEEKISLDSDKIESYLNDRDKRFYESSKNEQGISFLDENIDIHRQQLRYKQSVEEPLKLVSDAMSALDAIDQKHKAFSKPDVMDKVRSINDKTMSMLNEKSPERLLNQVIQILEGLDVSHADDDEALLKKVKNVGHLAYQIEKKIKG